MRFRPCIDIHDGKVKQIVGGSLSDTGGAVTNFETEQSAADFAAMYRDRNLAGGHVILLNPAGTEAYEKDIRAAKEAFAAYPGGLMVGGGVNHENAEGFLEMGASHVIVTSYVFRDGKIDRERLERLIRAVGKEHICLDLSCRKKDGDYYIVTDRWQKFTDMCLTASALAELSESADEFLVHAVDAEGKRAGVDRTLIQILAEGSRIPVTYAGGVGDFEDLSAVKEAGGDKVDVTIGSALSLFGGDMDFEEVIRFISGRENDK